jgi:hypothetical protein
LVRDGDPFMGTSPQTGLMGRGGRGLRIAKALSDAWGIDHEPTGKTVWAAFTVAPAPAHA